MRLRTIPLIVAAIALLGVHMVLLASSAPMIRTLRVHLAGWPATASPLRIILLADLHLSTPGDTPARLSDTVVRVDALKPDLVLLAGDFIATGISDARSYSPADSVAPLSALHPRLGTVAVLGNHDYPAAGQVRRALAVVGIDVLDNTAVRVGPLAIVGVSDDFSRHDRVPQAIAAWRRIGGVPIVLTHSPDVIPKLPPSVSLVLAGHTHCGQVRFPLIGAPITQSRYGQRYACGIVREGSRISVITAGLGVSSLPIRLGVPPDLWMITVGP